MRGFLFQLAPNLLGVNLDATVHRATFTGAVVGYRSTLAHALDGHARTADALAGQVVGCSLGTTLGQALVIGFRTLAVGMAANLHLDPFAVAHLFGDRIERLARDCGDGSCTRFAPVTGGEMKRIDIGCNLTHDSFDDDRDEVIAKARDTGVVQMVVTGASADVWGYLSELERTMVLGRPDTQRRRFFAHMLALQDLDTKLGQLAHRRRGVPQIAELAEFAARELAPFGFEFGQIDDYWQEGIPYLDQVIIEPIPDDTVRETALLGGEGRHARTARMPDQSPTRDRTLSTRKYTRNFRAPP